MPILKTTASYWIAILLICCCFFHLPGQTSDGFTPLIEQLKPNVVAIKAVFAGGDIENGFGFITGEKSGRLFLATAAHVVRGAYKNKTPQTIEVRFSNDLRWLSATFIKHWDQEDLALLEIEKPYFAEWQPLCADSSPGTNHKVRFIGLNDDEPNWVDPGLDGNIFKQDDKLLHFAINTIRRGTSGAPLISEKGIAGLITEDAGSVSRALKITQIQTLFSGGGKYPYYGLLPTNTIAAPPIKKADEPISPPISPTEEADAYGLIPIKGGTFIMGCTDEQGSDCYSDEKPSHRVTVSDFLLGKYEVTQAQWRKIMGSNPSSFSGCDECPVEQVSWDDIQAFLRKLNFQTGKNYRLPTEAEWEYAARGGNKSAGYKYAGSNNISDVAWFTDNAGSKTHPVGGKKANELGLYDMSGNVYEWCQDWKGDYSSSSQTNPSGAGTGSNRVFRGGSWCFAAGGCRVSFRLLNTPSSRNISVGFRLAL